ncbi:hypothetical protein [Parasitella parasitica]|uniref:Uncharacterized protein n=1 Tax=Parasitella parasitica TaxID=35722 RepID=A0A0B7NPH3_9FUNG|nr:hypothetical protein [Parasitella parasitica]
MPNQSVQAIKVSATRQGSLKNKGFFIVYDFSCFGYQRSYKRPRKWEEHIQPNASYRWVRFARKKKELEKKAALELEDFSKEEVEQLFLPVAVDPGRKTSFAGTDRRRRKILLKRAAGIENIESQIPTAKTVNMTRTKQYIEYILANIQSSFRFYNFQSAPFRFYDNQGKQRANAEMANILLKDGRKYNKAKRRKTSRNKRRKRRRRKSKNQGEIQAATSNYLPKESIYKKSKFISSGKLPVVVFGDGLKNEENVPMKGQLSGTSGVVLKSLYERLEQLTVAVVMMNEHNASKIVKTAQSCETGTLMQARTWLTYPCLYGMVKEGHQFLKDKENRRRENGLSLPSKSD